LPGPFQTPAATTPPQPAGVAEGSRDGLEVWQAVVQVREAPDGSGRLEYEPLTVKKKHSFHSTLTLSPSGLADALGRGNGSEVYKVWARRGWWW
jgi:hypothetical protein